MIKKVTVSHEIEIIIIDESKFFDFAKKHYNSEMNSALMSISFDYCIGNRDKVHLNKNSDSWCGIELLTHDIQAKFN